jgi:hypothetical protein
MILNRTSGKAATLIWILIILLLTHPAVLAEPPSVIEVGAFSAEKTINPVPARWEPFSFKNIERHTKYRLIEEDGLVVVKAD